CLHAQELRRKGRIRLSKCRGRALEPGKSQWATVKESSGTADESAARQSRRAQAGKTTNRARSLLRTSEQQHAIAKVSDNRESMQFGRLVGNWAVEVSNHVTMGSVVLDEDRHKRILRHAEFQQRSLTGVRLQIADVAHGI